MVRIITTYVAVILLVSLGFFGVTTLEAFGQFSRPEIAPMAANPKPAQAAAVNPKPQPEPLRLSSIIYSAERKVAIIDDQTLAIGDRIKGAELIGLTRDSARLRRRGKIITLRLGAELTAIRKKATESNL